MTQFDTGLARRLRRKILCYLVLGLLLVGIVVSCAALVPLYRSYRHHAEEDLRAAVAAKTAAIEESLSRSVNIAAQISSRTAIRKKLESYSDGRTELAELAVFTTEKLVDAMRFSREIRGVYRFDTQGRLISATGVQAPGFLKGLALPKRRRPEIYGVTAVAQGLYLLVLSPVLNRRGEQFGTDAVLFDTASLEKIIANTDGIGKTGRAFLGQLRDGSPQVVLPSDSRAVEHGGSADADDCLKRALALALQRQNGLLSSRDQSGTSAALAYGPIARAPLAIVVSQAEDELYMQVHRQIVAIGLLLAGMVLLGAGGMVVLLRPLTGRMILRSEELEREVQRAAAALQLSEHRFQTIVDAIAEAVICCDARMAVIYCNAAAERMFGYASGELVGLCAGVLMSPAALQSEEKFKKRHAAEASGMYKIESEARKKDGSLFPVLMSSAKWQLDGQPCFVSIVQDITLRRQAEEEIRTARDFLENIFQACPDILIMTDGRGIIQAVNNAIEDALGYTAQEVIGRQMAVFLPAEPSLRAQGLAMMKDLFDKRSIRGSEQVWISKGGGHCHVEVNAVLMHDAMQKLTGALSVVRDITDRKSMERELDRTRKNLINIFDVSRDIILVTDASGDIVHASASVFAMIGCRPEELIGLQAASLTASKPGTYQLATGEKIDITDEFLEGSRAHMETLFADGAALNWEHYFLRRDGLLIPVGMNVVCLHDADGSFTGTLAIVRDVTDTKIRERQLQEANEHLEKIFETSADGILVTAPHGVITSVNRAAAEMLGYERHDLVGRSTVELTPQDARQTGLGMEFITTLLENGKVAGFEREYLRGDGTRVDVEMSATLFTDAHGGITGSVAILRDITGRRKLEKEREQALERLQRAEKMETIGLLAGGVAHDLNNVLGAVVGYPEVLLDSLPGSSSLRKPLLAIRDSGDRAAAIVQDLLTLTRRGVVMKEVVSLNAVIDHFFKTPEFEKMQQFHPAVAFETDLAPDLFNIEGSPMHIAKVIMNLVSNAAEAISGSGKITVATRNIYLDVPLNLYEEIAEGDYVVVTVADTGSGISPHDLTKIFEPFYTKKVMGRSGTGLGMAVVWGTVKDHRGYIDIASRPGEGTVIKVYLPATRENAAAKEAVAIEQYYGAGERILVVDDILSQREIARTILAKLRYAPADVASGEAALQYLQTASADLLVLDMIMDPGMDGLETYKRILELHPSQKAVIVSGFAETERVAEAQRLGAGAYVKKPYTMEKLGRAVMAELRRNA